MSLTLDAGVVVAEQVEAANELLVVDRHLAVEHQRVRAHPGDRGGDRAESAGVIDGVPEGQADAGEGVSARSPASCRAPTARRSVRRRWPSPGTLARAATSLHHPVHELEDLARAGRDGADGVCHPSGL